MSEIVLPVVVVVVVVSVAYVELFVAEEETLLSLEVFLIRRHEEAGSLVFLTSGTNADFFF